MVISYPRFGTTYWSHLKGSRSLSMGPIGRPETSIRNFQSSLHNDPEERSSDQRSLIPCKNQCCLFTYTLRHVTDALWILSTVSWINRLERETVQWSPPCADVCRLPQWHSHCRVSCSLDRAVPLNVCNIFNNLYVFPELNYLSPTSVPSRRYTLVWARCADSHGVRYVRSCKSFRIVPYSYATWESNVSAGVIYIISRRQQITPCTCFALVTVAPQISDWLTQGCIN